MRGFIIDTDHLDGRRNGALYSHRQDTKEQRTLLRAFFQGEQGFKFRMYDDDGELYYSGRCASRDDNGDFESLNWAMNDSGCTRIDYLEPSGAWVTL